MPRITILDTETTGLIEPIEAIEVAYQGILYTPRGGGRIPTVMPFGKHKGELIKEIPSSYKQWLRNQPDVDEYLLKAIA